VLYPTDIISYLEMCQEEGASLQRGMNYRLHGNRSVILMSLRPGAPYADRVEENGRVLVYEGHDAPASRGGPNPKEIDQPLQYPGGSLTQNGLFVRAATQYRDGEAPAERVRVYEKIRNGIWVFNGWFNLLDAWQERSEGRLVFKFKLELAEDQDQASLSRKPDVEQTRMIPTSVKLEVWRRDRGQCVLCGSPDNLHFDHVIPYSAGGSSLVAANIQLLCIRHNLEKRDRIV
jgi:hypothetical protein